MWTKLYRVENVIHKLKLVNYIKCCKKIWLEICKIYVHERKKYYANAMTTNTSQNCEIWVEKKCKSSGEKENADQLCCQSMSSLNWDETLILSSSSLATKYCRFFFSLARLIEDSERQLISASYDSLQYYSYFGALTKWKDTPSCNSVVKVTVI